MVDPLSAPSRLSRRRFLALTAGLAAVAACGRGDDEGGAATSTTATIDTDRNGLAQFFPPSAYAATGRALRLPVGLIIDDVPAKPADAPSSLTVQIGPIDGDLGEPFVVARHGQGLPRAYYPVTTRQDTAGLYRIVAEYEGEMLDVTFAVDDPAKVKILAVGEAGPRVDTPTAGNARGLKFVCTREPVCPLHDITLRQALDAGRPTALLVSSPAFCPQSVCGPVLDIVLDVMGNYDSDIQFLHAEPYVDPTIPPNDWRASPVATALNIPFEPVLYLFGADGLVKDRLDIVFDEAEISAALDRLRS